ncbi:MAG: DUF1592 domain-containing protein [Candidatus Solibacter sp.]
MKSPRTRELNRAARKRRIVALSCGGALVAALVGSSLRGAEEAPSNPAPLVGKYCVQCHQGASAMGGVDLKQLTAASSVGENYVIWGKVASVLEDRRMPPKGMPAPSDEERAHAAQWIRAELKGYFKKHDGEPGKVTVRRLTSGEYAYVLKDLTGLEVETGIDASTDSVGGEGFSNYGDVQFMQDASLERYLSAAKAIAARAVIGTGPLEFYADPGKTGFEMSAIHRIRNIYTTYGFRTVSGEGGRPFGLDKYGKAFFVAWQYKNRAALGQPNGTIKELATREGVSVRLSEHLWSVMNQAGLSYPSSEMVARWKKLPAAAGTDPSVSAKAARLGCDEIQQYLTTWPSWLFGRGDLAAGGAGDESPLVFNDKALAAAASHHFVFNRFGRGGGGGFGGGGGGGRAQAAAPTGPTKIYLSVAQLNPSAPGKPVIVWKNPTVAFRKPGAPGGGRGPGGGGGAGAGGGVGQNGGAGGGVGQNGATGQTAAVVLPQGAAGQAGAAASPQGGGGRRGFGQDTGPRTPLRSAVSETTAKRLNFGQSPDGSQIGPDDFASEGSVNFELIVPEGMQTADFQVDATVGADRDQVFRITLAAEENPRGIPTRAIVGDPKSAGYAKFKAGVLEFAKILPPNSNAEPTPADKDPTPEPFDSTYNTPEHDAFVNDVKYIRDDRFVVEHLLDDAQRARLEHAWNDLKSSFQYHDSYLRLLALHFNLKLKAAHISELTKAEVDSMPAEARKYIAPLHDDYVAVKAAQAAARPRHLNDCLQFAANAWRHALSEKEKQGLRTFYDKTVTSEGDHDKAIRALITRILISPAFLYRVEQPVETAAARSLNNWDMASRLSFFLWASIPDAELQRAAAAGELADAQHLRAQVKRMLADPKARRLSTEFFGQWLGFYHFDQFRGVDTARFPEFTDEIKASMYDEAISFFEHVIRKDRPVREILVADYSYLNQPLAKFYGIKDVKTVRGVELVEGTDKYNRGGLLRLGAILTATSAPLRTSPVKRGDWVLRRVLGTPVPPPPANVPKIPEDEKGFGDLTLRQTLEMHKQSPTCANCHLRIDPLGFPLEHYDSTGRWREKYSDGKAIDDSGVINDQAHTEIAGIKGLLGYLETREDQLRRTMATKLVGYALGRTVQAADQLLIDRMVNTGNGATFSQLISEIVISNQFRNHAGKGASPASPHVKTAAVPALQPNRKEAGAR